MRSVSLITLLTVLLYLPAFGQFDMSADKVGINSYISVEQVPQGSEFLVAVVMQIEEGWHINAVNPTLDWLIPTTLSVEPGNDVIIADQRYPAAKVMSFAFAEDEPLRVYEGTAPIFLSMRSSSSIETGEQVIRGNLTVQACDDQTCLPPSNIRVEIRYDVVEAGTEVVQVNEELFALFDTYVQDTGLQNEIAGMFESDGFLLAFVAIFFIGLALNLTPCVYPMISVTVSLFGTQTETNTLKVFFRAVIYVLGIATMYSVLGVAAAMSGGLFGSWLQSPWMLGFIAFLMFGLALSMFGLYEIQIPYWLTKRLGGSGATTGILGIYISGLVVGIFAAPCVGPPIIALLAYVGSVGDPVFGFWSFFILSLGLGFPYLILGTFSGLMQNLPRSGVWMVWVKKVFGIVLIGVGFFYGGLALFPKIVPYVIPVTLVAGGIYLGFIEKTGLDKKGFTRFRYAFGVIAIVLGVMVFQNLQKPGVEWQSYSAEKLEHAANNNQAVILDFYADWCIPCLELDQITFTDPAVIDATSPFMRLKVDLTQFDSPESEELRRQYEIAGVPTIVFLDGQGNEIRSARVVGFLRPNEFLSRVSMVAP
ncbi:MAG: cytochrome c biogenesis protein CcdA [Cyclonatronaceae bacterium]